MIIGIVSGYCANLKTLSSFSLNAAISCPILSLVMRAYIWVVVIRLCPNILLTVSSGTPCVSVTVVAKVCRAMWNRIAKASDGEEVKIKRKPLGISDISVFCQVEKMQTTTEY